jgi:hypothetical protein
LNLICPIDNSSLVGYCVGWCCANRSSFSMCINVVFPALSNPYFIATIDRTRVSRREIVVIARRPLRVAIVIFSPFSPRATRLDVDRASRATHQE